MHPLTLTPNSSSQASDNVSSENSASERKLSNTPALPTKTSRRPNAATVSATARLLSASWATSPVTAMIASPNSALSSSALPGTRSRTPTPAPSALKRAATARPIPEPPPVTNATCPSSQPTVPFSSPARVPFYTSQARRSMSDLGRRPVQHLSVALSDDGVSPGEGYLEETPALRAHAGTQPDLFLRWNRIPFSAQALDVIVFLHGFSQQGSEMPLAEKVMRSGLDLSGRTRPTLAMLPRGNWIRHYYYDFPALLSGGLDQLVDYGLSRFSRVLSAAPGGPPALALDRFILSAHSGC